jgi:hypothetical protein
MNAAPACSVTPFRPWWHDPGLALLALLLSVLFFSPHLWLMQEYRPGTTQWDRAHTFLLQCEQPLRRDIEPAMLWRLLPPVVAHALHLPGRTPLLLPWLGLLVTTGYVARLLRRRLDDSRYVFGGTLLYATTSAVLVPVSWLGMNDSWVWLGLLAVSFGRSAWAAPLACLLCPWIDERFVLGFPLAWLVARLDRHEAIFSRSALLALWLLPYAAVRLTLSRHDASASAATDSFLRMQFTHGFRLLPLVPLAWWMGLRAAWAPVGYAFWDLPRARGALVAGVLLGTLGVCVILASDLSRSVAISLPLVLAGCFAFARREPVAAPRLLFALGVINLLIPAAHMTYVNIDPINPLPIELYRLFR